MAEPHDDELGREVRSVLRQDLLDVDLPPGAQQQLWQGLSDTLGFGPPGGPGEPGGTDQGPGPGGVAPPAVVPPGAAGSLAQAVLHGGRLTSGLIGLGLGVVVGAAGHAALVRPPAAAPVSRPAAAVAASDAPGPPDRPVASSPATAAVEPPPPPERASASAPARAEPAAAPAAGADDRRAPAVSASSAPAAVGSVNRDDQLSAERALIDVARTAVGRGQGSTAIEALQRHVAEFPRGRLTEEREGLWIQALLQSGQRDQARERLARFRRLAPRSMMLPALEAAIGPP